MGPREDEGRLDFVFNTRKSRFLNYPAHTGHNIKKGFATQGLEHAKKNGQLDFNLILYRISDYHPFNSPPPVERHYCIIWKSFALRSVGPTHIVLKPTPDVQIHSLLSF